MQQQQQPFFKMSNNSHYFSLERFSSNFGHEPKSSAPKQVAQNFFKQPAAKLKEIDVEATKKEQHSALEISGTEKMSGLYSRIHQEAEKLQKWKAAVVSELKQKDQQLEESNTNNGLLRKSLVDLQVENENVSSSLQNEKLAHQEMRQQIHTTRNMCIALKDHVARVEATIEQGEADKEELKHNEQQIVDTYQELAEQFKQLQLHSANEQEHLRLQVEDQRKQNVHLTNEHESAITAANNKLRSLEDKVANQKTITEQLQKEIDHKSSQCVKLQECLDATGKELQSFKQENESKSTQLNITMEDLSSTKRNNKQLQDELNQLKSSLNQIEIQLKDQQNLLSMKEQAINQLEEQLNQNKAILKDTENRLELNEKQSVEDKSTIADLKSSVTLLQEVVENYKKEVQSIESDKELLSDHLHKTQDELRNVIETMNKERSKLLNEKTSAEDESKALREDLKACHTENGEYQQQLILMKEIVEKKQAELSEVAERSMESVDLICGKLFETLQHAAAASEYNIEDVDKKCPVAMNATIVKCVTILCNQREEVQSVSEGLVNDNREMQKTLKELQQSLDDVNAKLEQQEQLLADNEKTGLNNVKSLEKEIKLHSKQVNTLTSRNSKLQAQLDSKSQTVNDLKSEVKKYRDNLKEAEKTLSSLNQQLNHTAKEKDELLCQYEEQVEQLKNEIVTKSESLTDTEEKETQLRLEIDHTKKLLRNAENEAKQCREQSQDYQRQQKEDKAKFDREMSEMCATLEKYKAENQKMLSQKEKEIEMLKEHQQNSTNMMEDTLRLEAEIARLKSMVDNVTQEKDIALNEHKSAMVLVENLKKQLNEKDCQPMDSTQVAKLPMSGTNTPKTPKSRGILKQVSTNKSGNKRVAFVSSGSDQSDTETEIVKENKLQADIQRTPVHNNELSKLKSTRSPNVRIAPSLRDQQKSGTATRKFTSSAKKACVSTVNDSEMSQFKELFPNFGITDRSKEKKAGFKRNTKSNDVKSTPNKSFKYSSLSVTKKPSSRTSKKSTSSKQQPDMSWFEIDPIFGFTAED